MPATRCQATFLFAAACGLTFLAAPVLGGDVAIELEDALNGDDEVHLLQERVFEKHRSNAKLAAQEESAAEQKAPSVCKDPPSTYAKAPAEPDMYLDESQLTPEALTDSPVLKKTPLLQEDKLPVQHLSKAEPPKPLEEDEPDTTKTSTLIFRYTMDVLIVLVLLDGCRRWNGRAGDDNKAAEARDEAPQGSEQFQCLMRAVCSGEEARARELLGHAPSMAVETDAWDCTALHAAAKGGMHGLAAELIDLGAELDAADSWDETPLHMASRAGHTQMCELLIARGAKVDAINAQSWTPLVAAGHAERSDACRLLLGKGASVGGLSEKELPPLLQLLHPFGEEDATPTTVAPEDEEEEQRQWPTEEDWEEHMKESVGF